MMIALFLTANGFASTASAASLEGMSRSFLLSRESLGGEDFLPGYEYLNLEAREGAFSAHFGGWGRYDFRDERGDTDIQYAYLRYKRDYDNTMVNLGRVMVFEGVATERLDGIYGRTDLAGGVGVSAFGGVPAQTGGDLPGSDILYGARLYHSLPDLYSIGLSFLLQEKNDDPFRREQGIDLWLRLRDRVQILGRSTYNSLTDGWMDHAYNLLLGPFGRVTFDTQVRKYNYRDYLSTMTNPALLFVGQSLRPEEEALLAGEEVSYRLSDQVTVSANYRAYRYELAGDASSFGAVFAYASQANSAGFAVDRVNGNAPELDYTRYRAYGSKRLGRYNVAVDLIDLAWDEAVNGETDSYTAILAAEYAMTESLRIGADVQLSCNPYFEQEVRAMAKLFYAFGASWGGGS